jgi:hypothetical protein
MSALQSKKPFEVGWIIQKKEGNYNFSALAQLCEQVSELLPGVLHEQTHLIASAIQQRVGPRDLVVVMGRSGVLAMALLLLRELRPEAHIAIWDGRSYRVYRLTEIKELAKIYTRENGK